MESRLPFHLNGLGAYYTWNITLLGPISGASAEVFYAMGCADEDMFLRVNEIE
jgi:hypothetical protein